MSQRQKQLLDLAQEHPYWMFTVEEIALIFNLSRDFVTKVKFAPDSPFCLHVCRPEWFREWMRNHPKFQLTKDPHPKRKSVVKKSTAQK